MTINSKILIFLSSSFLFLLTFSTVIAAVPKEHKGVYAGGGFTYNFMTAEWYDLNRKVDDAPGILLEAGYKLGGPIRIGFRYWSSFHHFESNTFLPNRFRFYGIETEGKLLFFQKSRIRPYFLLGYARIFFRAKNDEGYTGFGYSFASGVEYWLNDYLTFATEFDVRYVDFTGVQISESRFRSVGAVNATMLSLKILRITWHY